MFYDYPAVKLHLRKRLILLTKLQMRSLHPILGRIGEIHQHEGKSGSISRPDGSSAELNYPREELRFSMTREEMKIMDVAAIHGRLTELAMRLAAGRLRLLWQRASEAAEEVGNVVNVGGDFRMEHYLDMLSRVQLEFDRGTGELSPSQMLWSSPQTEEVVQSKLVEWEADPEFVAARNAIVERKRREWRDREDCRKLVD